MSKLFTDSSPLVKQPHSEYWDGALTRREAQAAINKLASNDSELIGMADTAALILNFLCERAGVKREELDEFVEKKKEEVAVMREALRLQAEEQQKAGADGQAG